MFEDLINIEFNRNLHQPLFDMVSEKLSPIKFLFFRCDGQYLPRIGKVILGPFKITEGYCILK